MRSSSLHLLLSYITRILIDIYRCCSSVIVWQTLTPDLVPSWIMTPLHIVLCFNALLVALTLGCGALSPLVL